MIAVYNDGKQKHQSFEAIFTDKNEGGYALLDLSGYGATEEEAVADLKEKHAAYLAELTAISSEVVGRHKGRP